MTSVFIIRENNVIFLTVNNTKFELHWNDVVRCGTKVFEYVSLVFVVTDLGATEESEYPDKAGFKLSKLYELLN